MSHINNLVRQHISNSMDPHSSSLSQNLKNAGRELLVKLTQKLVKRKIEQKQNK